MSRYFFILSLFLIIIGCKSESAPQKVTKETSPKVKSIPETGQFIHDDLTFDYSYDATKDNTSIKIKGKVEESYSAKGKVIKYFFSDLDADTKDEAFIVLEDNKGNSLIKSFYIAGGNAIEIYMAEVKDTPPNSKKTYASQYGQLIEKIEVKTPDNNTLKSDVRYNLVSGEASYILKPQGWNKDQLKTKTGQFKTAMYGKEKYYNKLYINESETGEWIVDIKVKDSKTERNVCEFQAVGEFINKDLYVPLNYANPALDGVLQIRFAGQSTIVYTQDKEDAKQMSTICKGKGNLSGNYTKLKVLYE